MIARRRPRSRHRRAVDWARRRLRAFGLVSILGVAWAAASSGAPFRVGRVANAETDVEATTGTIPVVVPDAAPAPAAEGGPPTALSAPLAVSSTFARATEAARTSSARSAAERRAADTAARAAVARAAVARGDVASVPAGRATRAGASSSNGDGAVTVARDPAPAGSRGARIALAARAYVGRGIPYVFGGKTLAGTDCSGLVWFVLRDAGLSAPYRSSGALLAWTRPVLRANAQPGDLVLYVGHVGVYVGGGMMVDHGGPGAGANLRPVWGAPVFGRIP